MSSENCEPGMERTGVGVPLVVENRPFILEAQKSGRDLQRCLGRVCSHVMLRRGSARR